MSLGIWKCDQLLRFPTISKISRMENVPVCKSISLMTPCPCSNKRRCIDGERSLLTTVFGCGKDGSSLSGFSCVNLLAAALLHCCSKEGEEDCDDELLDRELHARFMVHSACHLPCLPRNMRRIAKLSPRISNPNNFFRQLTTLRSQNAGTLL